MYRYEYVPLYTGGGFWLNNSDSQHREIIDRYAAAGWRYVGYIPTEFTGNGGTKSIELIFVREAGWSTAAGPRAEFSARGPSAFQTLFAG